MASRFVPAAATLTPAARSPARQTGRKERRIPHRTPCRVTYYDPVSGEPSAVVGETINISRRGLAIRLHCQVPFGTWLETLIPRQLGGPMFLCGDVIYCRRVLADEYEVGIELGEHSEPPVF